MRRRDPDLLSQQMIDNCLVFFFRHMYPTLPILHKGQLLEKVAREIDQSIEVYCLIMSICAFMMIQPGMSVLGKSLGHGPEREDWDAGKLTTATLFLEEILRLRKLTEFVENPTIGSLQTSFFLFACYFGLEKHHRAWYHLREATTLAQLIGMQDERSYLAGDPIDSIMKRRLYWLLFVTERAYALQRHRPLTLHATIGLPTPEEIPADRLIIQGFLHMINLFRPFDDTFVGLWNKSRNDCSTAWLAQLQRRLSDALPPKLSSTKTQAADIITTQQWLRTMVWQLSITNGYLSSASPNASMTFRYPIEIARDLMTDVSTLPQHALEVHGIGLIEKLFDVACTVADVIACVPLDCNIFQVGPTQYLNQFLTLISTLRGGGSRFPPLLLAKISENLPSLAVSIAKNPIPIKEEELDDFDSPSSTTSASLMLPSPSVMPTVSFPTQNQYFSGTSPSSSDRSAPLATSRTAPPMESTFYAHTTYAGRYG